MKRTRYTRTARAAETRRQRRGRKRGRLVEPVDLPGLELPVRHGPVYPLDDTKKFYASGFPTAKYITDAHEAKFVDVTEDDCSKGVPLDPWNCAFALGARRDLHVREGDVHIGLTRSHVLFPHADGDVLLKFGNGTTVSRETTSFDRSKEFAPGRYRLSPIAPSSDRALRSEKNREAKRRPMKPEDERTARNSADWFPGRGDRHRTENVRVWSPS